MEKIPFNRVHVVGHELANLKQVLETGHLAGDGPFTKECHKWLEAEQKAKKALLVTSGTTALDMAALLIDLKPGDEVIVPSYTFVATANAIVLRGATPVFVDCDARTMNMDPNQIEKAITAKTKAIFVVHYAGVSADMDPILEIAKKKNLLVVEDAAQGILAKYKGRFLGTMGCLGTLSFHETKNVVAGEGGAILINDDRWALRAEIIREKGTNRSQFFRGEVDKYTWVDVGSAFLPSELIAAVLLPQLQNAAHLNNRRAVLWNRYYESFHDLESQGKLERAFIPSYAESNHHIFFMFCRNLEERTALSQHLKNQGMHALFHYVPLHSAPAGRKFGRTSGDLKVTEQRADQLLRLPIYMGLEKIDRIIEAIHDFYKRV